MRAIVVAVVACVLAFAAASASAQTYPAKSIRVIDAYPPAARPSHRAHRRVKFQESTAALDRRHRPGAQGNIGTELAAKAPPDGYTLLMFTAATRCIQASTEHAYDFLSVCADHANHRDDNVLVVHPSVPVKT